MWNNSPRELWNISLRSMWNEICPHSRQRIFHICKANISQRGYFTCPKGQISLKKAHICPVDKCVLFSGCGGGIWTSRPPGYEPDELPGCSTPRYWFFEVPIGAGDRGRTGTILSYHGILSPGRLPIPPHRRIALWHHYQRMILYHR